MTSDTEVYRVIANIPECLGAVDLRNYFSFLVERESFDAFNYEHTTEKFLMGTILRIKANVSMIMEKKGFKLSDRNARYSNANEDIFHSVECSDNEDENDLKTLPASLKQMKLTENNLSDEVANGQNSSDTIGESLLEGLNYRKNDMQSSLLNDDEEFYSDESGSEQGDCVEEDNIQIDSTSNDDERYCCVVRIKKEFDVLLKKWYHQKFWVDVNGNILPVRCIVLDFDPLQLVMDYVPARSDSEIEKTRDEIFEDALTYTHGQLHARRHKIFSYTTRMLPHGNIGESIEYIQNLFEEYEVEKNLMKDLGLKFNVNSAIHRFCKLPFLYNTESNAGKDETRFDLPRVFTANGDLIPSYCDLQQINRRGGIQFNDYFNDPGNEENESSVMDWHTYDEFHKITSKKERNREIYFKEDIKLIEENGDNGVVQYFDGQFWYQNEGGDEMRSRDCWKVDTKVDHERRVSQKLEKTKFETFQSWSRERGKTWARMRRSEVVVDRFEGEYVLKKNENSSYYFRQFLLGLIGSKETRKLTEHYIVTRPNMISTEIWDNFFKSAYIELYGVEEEKRQTLTKKERKQNGEKQAKNKNRKKKSKSSKKRRAHDVKVPSLFSINTNNYPFHLFDSAFNRSLPAFQGNMTYEQFRKAPLLGNNPPLLPNPTFNYRQGLLKSPFPSPWDRDLPLTGRNPYSRSSYDVNGYDEYGRSVFGNSSFPNRFSGYDDYYDYDAYLMNDPKFLVSQGFNSKSIRSFMRCAPDDYNGQLWDGSYDSRYSNYLRKNEPKSDKKSKKEKVNAPTAKYKNDGSFTSGIALLNPSSCCIFKDKSSARECKENGSQVGKTTCIIPRDDAEVIVEES